MLSLGTGSLVGWCVRARGSSSFLPDSREASTPLAGGEVSTEVQRFAGPSDAFAGPVFSPV